MQWGCGLCNKMIEIIQNVFKETKVEKYNSYAKTTYNVKGLLKQ